MLQTLPHEKETAIGSGAYLESNADLQKDIEIIKKNPVLSKRSTQKMKKAYSAVIQTLELAANDVLDEATAILQVMRFLGRKIAKFPVIPQTLKLTNRFPIL